MHISGTEHSSLILSQIMYCKRQECGAQIMRKEVEANRDGLKKTHKFQFQSIFNTLNFDVLKLKSTKELMH